MKKLMAILLVIMLLLPVAAHAADFGSFSGDMDFGGSDWSGGSSFDFGDLDFGDSDYDDSEYEDYDDSDYDDYNDSDYSDSGSSFGAGVVAGSLLDEIFEDDDDNNDSGDDDGNMFLGVIIVAAVVVIILISRKKKRGKGPKAEPRPAGGNVTPQDMLRPMSEYPLLDPNFDGADLAEKISNLYVQMQNAWTDKDIAPVRPYFTDALYQQMERQVSMLAKTGRTNYVERIAVLGVTLRGFMQKNGEDHIIVELRTRIVDYTMDDNTGKLISGSQTAEKFMTYEWEISRASGIVTTKGDNMQHVSCPNCGAPLDINATAKCPYCDSIVTLEEHNWAICAIRGISQTTK